MWFNSTVSEEPHQGLKLYCIIQKCISLRGCIAGAARLSSARVVRCSVKSGNERNPYFVLLCHERPPSSVSIKFSAKRAGRKAGMTSNQRGPLTPWATHVLQWLVQREAKPRGGANPKKPVSVRIGVCNSTP